MESIGGAAGWGIDEEGGDAGGGVGGLIAGIKEAAAASGGGDGEEGGLDGFGREDGGCEVAVRVSKVERYMPLPLPFKVSTPM